MNYQEAKAKGAELGINTHGMKKDEILAAIAVKESPAVAEPTEEAAPADKPTLIIPKADAAPVYHTNTISGEYRGKPWSYDLSDLFSYLKKVHELTGVRVKVNLEELTITAFNKRAQASKCTTLKQPYNIIQRFIREATTSVWTPAHSDPNVALDFVTRKASAERNKKPFNTLEFKEYIVDTDDGIDVQLGKVFEV